MAIAVSGSRVMDLVGPTKLKKCPKLSCRWHDHPEEVVSVRIDGKDRLSSFATVTKQKVTIVQGRPIAATAEYCARCGTCITYTGIAS